MTARRNRQTTPVPVRVRSVLALRRSNASRPHRNRARYHRPTANRATTREA